MTSLCKTIVLLGHFHGTLLLLTFLEPRAPRRSQGVRQFHCFRHCKRTEGIQC